MKAINKESTIQIYWKIWRGENKATETFNDLKVFLVGLNNTYHLSTTIDTTIDPGYNVISITIGANTLQNGAYSLKAIWKKSDLVSYLTSTRSGVFGITDSTEEATVQAEEIRLVSYVESYGRDGMSAYEIAVMRGLNKGISSEEEWVGSEVDRQKSESLRVEAEDIRKAQENTRKENEDTRETQETIRQSQETTRESNETTRQSRETTREGNETTRRNNEDTRKSNETTRETREAVRESNESTRESNEATRENREAVRESNESTRKSNETTRQTRFEEAQVQRAEIFNRSESDRQSAFEESERNRGLVFSAAEEERERQETIRQENENTRLTQESVRQQAEQIRIDTFDENERERIATFEANEAARQTNETTRIANEEERIANETIRQASYLDKVPTSAIVQETGDGEDLIMSQKVVSEKLDELVGEQNELNDLVTGEQKVEGIWNIPTSGTYKNLAVGLSMRAGNNYQIRLEANIAPTTANYPSIYDNEGNALVNQTWSSGNTSCIFNYTPSQDYSGVSVGGYYNKSFDGVVVSVILRKSEGLVNDNELTEDNIKQIETDIELTKDNIEQIETDIEQIETDIEQIKKTLDPAILTSLIAYGGSAVNGATGTYSDGVLGITSSTAYGAGGFYMPSNKGKILVVSKLENTSSRDVTITKNIGGNWKKYSDSNPTVDTGVNAFLSTSVKVATIAPNGVKYYAEIFDTEASYEYTGIIFMFIGLLEGDTMNVSTKLYSFTDDYSLFNPADEDMAKSLYDNGTYVESNNKSWEGKRLLAIGDSVTAMYYDSGLPETGYGFYSWADKVGSLLNMKVRKHAEGGIGLIQMVDGHGTDAPSGVDPDTFNNKVYKLNTDDVKDVDVIIVMGMYNEYGILSKDVGTVTDMYVDSTTGNTFMGRLNYAIKRIYEELAEANNLECKVLICGPHRHGKYPYSDEDAYQKGDLLNNSAKTVADYHSLHYIDLMHRGMINKYNWSVAQKSSVALSNNYISSTGINDGNNHPFASVNDAPSAASNKDKLITVVGEEYAYKSDGSTWVYGYITCPWNADQLHPSVKGSDMIGEVIAGELNTIVV